MVDTRVGSAELECLAQALATPCQLGEYALEGLIGKTSTALVFIARYGAFGEDDGVLKLTGKEYAPVLERELGLLNACRAAEIKGIVQPVQSQLEWLDVDGAGAPSAVAILLPFLGGGDLVQWIGGHATRTGQLGPHLALEAGEHVGRVLCELLHLPRPLVHCDVKPQNVMLPYPDAPLGELTLIDLDVSEELSVSFEAFDSAPREAIEPLVRDVNGFGELLFELAMGRLPPVQGQPNPHTANDAFNSLVVKCLTSDPNGPGYVCLADHDLWRDLERALSIERAARHVGTLETGLARRLATRRWLACIGVVLFIALALALASRVFVG